MRLLHKLIGIDFLVSKERRQWYTKGYHVFDSKQEVMDRIREGKPLSCFCLQNTQGKVHVAFKASQGEENLGTNLVRYLTLEYNKNNNMTDIHEDTGVHFCKFNMVNEGKAKNLKVSTMDKDELREIIESYALMMPYRSWDGNRSSLQIFTLIHWDWEVLRCTGEGPVKGRAVVERSVFRHINDINSLDNE